MPQDRQVSDTDVFHCAKDDSRALALLPTEFWGHFAIQVACRVSPQVRWLKRPRHHIIIHDICPGIHSGQKDFHHRRALHKKKYCVLHREINEKIMIAVLSTYFLNSLPHISSFTKYLLTRSERANNSMEMPQNFRKLRLLVNFRGLLITVSY